MKLSIVTINYNNAEGLERTLNSVLVQTYEGIEHIIVDGGSTDGSVDVIKRYVQKAKSRESRAKSVIWVSERDNGIYNAMNKGIEIALGRRVVNALNRSELVEDKNIGIQRATGEYIQILNSGDVLAAPDVTERMVSALNDEMSRLRLNEPHTLNDGVSILYGNMMKDYGGGKLGRDMSGNGLYEPSSFIYFYFGTLNHDSAYIRRDLFDKYGLYNEEMKICSDWEWYVRAIAIGGEKAVYTNIDVTIFDMNGVSESGGKNAELIKIERREYLEKILPASVLNDYDAYAFQIDQYMRLKKHHMWGIVHLMERVVRKMEKWHILK